MTTPNVATAAQLVRLRVDDGAIGLVFETQEWTWQMVRNAIGRSWTR